MTAPQMEEPQYRQLVDGVFARIDAAFEDADPDLAECIVDQGALTVVFHEKWKLIVSPQTPVRQIWVAFRDRAWHLDLDAKSDRWIDDRGRDVELYSLVEQLTQEQAGIRVQIARP